MKGPGLHLVKIQIAHMNFNAMAGFAQHNVGAKAQRRNK